VTVDGENHYIADLDKQSKWHATIMAWFARWLQDDPRWWNNLYPDSAK
jgi:dipeptidyl aminopeptidase/acylaminoacyl peptidase